MGTQYENLPLSFESCGYIDRNYTGRVMIKLTNYSSKKIKLNSGCPIGYIVMQPYSMEWSFILVYILTSFVKVSSPQCSYKFFFTFKVSTFMLETIILYYVTKTFYFTC